MWFISNKKSLIIAGIAIIIILAAYLMSGNSQLSSVLEQIKNPISIICKVVTIAALAIFIIIYRYQNKLIYATESKIVAKCW